MKMWIKAGLIGAGIIVLLRMLLGIGFTFFYAQTARIIPGGDDLNLLIVGVAILIGFIAGSLIGLIIEKFR